MATETEQAHSTAAAGRGLPDNSADAPGMPQLDFSTFANQIFWLVVTLVVIYLVLSKIALPRIASVLAERQGTITNDIAAAEELKQQAADAEAAYEKALADARVEAGRIADEAKAEMQAEVDSAMIKADAEIAAQTAESASRIDEIRAGAADAVKVVARDTAKEVVAALGIDIDDKAVEAAVASQVKG
ncbi:F0F1 ATP synthase subunit B' [Rhodobacteraceae bacterium]|nr:F0F1 ATP synthase subunit B' [Paracoccaceae bacterium]